MPKKKQPVRPRPLYRKNPPKPSKVGSSRCDDRTAQRAVPTTEKDFPHAHVIAPAHFELREDGSIVSPHPDPLPQGEGTATAPSPKHERPPQRRQPDDNSPSPWGEGRGEGEPTVPNLIFTSDSPFLRLYHGNCLELLDAIAAKYGDAGRFDCIFADPPYFLSNGGITCHAGRMVKVDKGDWDRSISKTFGAARFN